MTLREDPAVMREYKRAWMADRRAQWIAANGGCCVECGATTNLQVDHIDPSTKVSHRVWSWRASRRFPELAKCQILCGSCHVAKTMSENGIEPAPHGTGRRYKHHGCRCTECRAGHAARESARRARVRRERAAAAPRPWRRAA